MRVLVVPPLREWLELRAAAIEAERIGFDGIIVPDHLTMSGRRWLEALTTMAALAEATRTVELWDTLLVIVVILVILRLLRVL